MKKRVWLGSAVVLGVLVALGFAIAASADTAAKAETYYLFVLNDPAPGLEDEFNRWYDQQHAQDVLVNPDYVNSQRYVASEHRLRAEFKPPNQYAIKFKIVTDDIATALGYIHQNIRSGKTVMTKSIAGGTARGGDFVYKAITDVMPGTGRNTKSDKQGTKKKYLQIVFATPVVGKEAQFNDLYNKVLAPKMAALPGVKQWQRFELSSVQLTQKMALAEPYMTMYDIETSDPASLDRLQEQVKKLEAASLGEAGKLGPSYTYEAIGPLLQGDDVKQERGIKAAN